MLGRRLRELGLSATVVVLVAGAVAVGATAAGVTAANSTASGAAGEVARGAPVGAAAVPATPVARLRIAAVRAPEINCLFAGDCTISPDDSRDDFALRESSGEATLQTRVWPRGESGTDGEGLTAYLYRVDLSRVIGLTALPCVSSMALDFGGLESLDYDDDGSPEEVFVVAGGGIGSVGLSRAEQTGDRIVFHFDSGLCAGSRTGDGTSSFFFGLASEGRPEDAVAEVVSTVDDGVSVDTRAPRTDGDPDDPALCLPGHPGLPVSPWAPVCRCLRDRIAREMRCALLHPDFLLVARTPFPIGPAEPFSLSWRLVPLTSLAAPVTLASELPPGLDFVQGTDPGVSFPASLGRFEATTSEQRLTATAGRQAGELILWSRVVYQGAGDRAFDGRLRLVLSTGADGPD